MISNEPLLFLLEFMNQQAKYTQTHTFCHMQVPLILEIKNTCTKKNKN